MKYKCTDYMALLLSHALAPPFAHNKKNIFYAFYRLKCIQKVAVVLGGVHHKWGGGSRAGPQLLVNKLPLFVIDSIRSRSIQNV